MLLQCLSININIAGQSHLSTNANFRIIFQVPKPNDPDYFWSTESPWWSISVESRPKLCVARCIYLLFLKKRDQFRLKIGGNIWRRREIMSNLGFPYLGSSYCGKNLCNWVQFTNSNYSVLPNIRKKSVMLCYHEQWL